MSRVLSALILLPVVLGTIWFLPPIATLVLAAIVLVPAFFEFAALAERLGLAMPRALGLVVTLSAFLAIARGGAGLEAVLMTAVLVAGAGAIARGGIAQSTLGEVATFLFTPLYLGLPLGAIVAVRTQSGAPAALLLILTVMASDTAQYYGGRAFGRRLLAPALSPKKTVEGAIVGFVGGAAAMALLGRWWLTQAPSVWLALLGAAVVALGIAGDLFESLLKRAAGVKDASHLIPGHGGMLDRIDSLLFAAPVYYVVIRYTS
jgi:phosphatidate cytidylyltransferase